MTKKDYNIQGINAVLKGTIYIPEENVKGIVEIVHGMAEHRKRYDNFCEFKNYTTIYAVCNNSKQCNVYEENYSPSPLIFPAIKVKQCYKEYDFSFIFQCLYKCTTS